MGLNVIEYELKVNGRKNMRNALIKEMLKEKPGTKDDTSKYRYNVDRFKQYLIFLRRPARFNKGIDFTVNIEGMYFYRGKKYSNPTHDEIIDAFVESKEEYPDKYKHIKRFIIDIYNCKSVNFEEQIGAFFEDYWGQKHPIEVALLLLKWLFMEQDCTYWNYSGRNMLYQALQEKDLV